MLKTVNTLVEAIEAFVDREKLLCVEAASSSIEFGRFSGMVVTLPA
jgi:hypothetical protein